MGWSFRKSFQVGKLVRLNLSKSGVSVSLGVPGAIILLGKRSRVTVGKGGWRYAKGITALDVLKALPLSAQTGEARPRPIRVPRSVRLADFGVLCLLLLSIVGMTLTVITMLTEGGSLARVAGATALSACVGLFGYLKWQLDRKTNAVRQANREALDAWKERSGSLF